MKWHQKLQHWYSQFQHKFIVFNNITSKFKKSLSLISRLVFSILWLGEYKMNSGKVTLDSSKQGEEGSKAALCSDIMESAIGYYMPIACMMYIVEEVSSARGLVPFM